jgi:beta-galactosidase
MIYSADRNVNRIFAFVFLLAVMVSNSIAAREITSLNGTWQIIFDRENIGKRDGWSQSETLDRQVSKSIPVPSCWEETEQDYEGVAWYTRTFTVPDEWRGRHVILRFGAVNYRAEIWVNGKAAGWHEGGYTPFELDVSKLLAYSEDNSLVVRVIGPLLTRRQFIDDLQQDEMPHWRGAIAGGIHQSVELLAVDPCHVADIFVEPLIDEDAARIHATIENVSLENVRVTKTIRIFREGSPEATLAEDREIVNVAPGRTEFDIELKIPESRLWSPDQPNLYVAQVQLQEEWQTLDISRARFGMRELTVRSEDFYLNGRRTYLKQIFVEGLYPTTLINPPDEEFLRREIILAKEAGFNVLRLWRKPAPKRMLDLADEMGIMVVAAPPFEAMSYGPTVTPQLETRLKAEVRELVLRDRNHPSIIYWEIFNEIVREALYRVRHEVSLEARRYDPSRLIIDESGGSRNKKHGSHMYLPYSSVPVLMLERHRNLGSPFDRSDYDYFHTYGDPGLLTMMTECGGGAFPEMERVMARYRREGNPKTPDYRTHELFLDRLKVKMREYGLDRIFNSVSEMCLSSQDIQVEGNKEVLEALRTNPMMDGYCVHAFTGGDWVLGSGILNIWREPKKAYYACQNANQPRLLVIRAEPRNAYAGRPVNLTITGVNEEEPLAGRLIITLTSDDDREVYRSEKTVSVAQGITNIFKETIPAASVSGHYVVRASFEGQQGEKLENTFQTLVMDASDLPAPADAFVLYDPENTLKPFATARGLQFKDYDPDKPNGPVFVCPSDAKTPGELAVFRSLMQYAENGGTVVLLNPPSDQFKMIWDRESWTMIKQSEQVNTLLQENILPFTPVRRKAQGNWIGLFHPVKQHPIFDGLSTGAMMGQDYKNVYAKEILLGIEGEGVSFTISFDWIHYYIGLTDVWVGKDVVISPQGKGHVILSTLRLLENLGKDPVADRILYNMISYAQSPASDETQ